jgi:phosphoserine phosphatase RsbU/P
MQPLIVPGRLDSLAKIGKYIMQAAKNAGLEKARAYKLRLAVDEIATNIINYGYPRAGIEGVISVEADLDEHALTITLDDSSGPYDSTLRPAPPAEYFTQPLEEREVGGWGVYLAIQSVDQFHYHRLQQHNHNIFIMYRPTHGHLLVIGSIQDSGTPVAQHLISLGYTVTCVENGQNALDLLRQQKFEMILLHIPMQDRNAEEFIQHMKANNALRGTPLIILTGEDHLEEAERCIKSGAEDYIVLPFRPAVLKARVSASLERRRVRFAEQTQKDIMKYERDVQIGHQIQQDFLPETLPQPAGWEIAAHFEEACEVAGDFYDAFVLPNQHISLIMGDVSDRGIASALFMVLFRSLLRAFAQQDFSARVIESGQEDSATLKNAIELTNAFILNNHASSNMFATIFFGILDPVTGRLSYINAGHEPPLMVNQGKVSAHLTPTGLAVGMLPDTDYEVQQTHLDPGDTLLIITDGITCAKNPSGQAFGNTALLELLAEPDLPAAALLSKIETNLRAHVAEADLADDITTLAVKRLA